MGDGLIRKWLVAALRPDRGKIRGLLGVMLAAAVGPAQAAWTEKQGTGLMIPSYTYYRAARDRDAHGPGGDRKAYVKNEFRPNSVYGWEEDVTRGQDRSEGRRVGQEWVSQGKSRWWAYH